MCQRNVMTHIPRTATSGTAERTLRRRSMQIAFLCFSSARPFIRAARSSGPFFLHPLCTLAARAFDLFDSISEISNELRFNQNRFCRTFMTALCLRRLVQSHRHFRHSVRVVDAFLRAVPSSARARAHYFSTASRLLRLNRCVSVLARATNERQQCNPFDRKIFIAL